MAAHLTPWPARLEWLQASSGLLLALFMWAHMVFVSSILLGKDAMYWVARMFEGQPLLAKPQPLLVSVVAAAVFGLFAVHAVIAARRFPSNYRQYRALYFHAKWFHHSEFYLWLLQVITGFGLLLLAPIHLYQMAFHPSDIGPYASADRVWSGHAWPLYLLLLFMAELHGGIGLYRLVIKWWGDRGFFAVAHRRRLIILKWSVTGFFLALGLLTLAAYMKIGYEHRHQVGERYVPVKVQE